MKKNNEKFGESKKYGKSKDEINNINSYMKVLGTDINSFIDFSLFPPKKLIRTEKIILENYKKFNGDIPRIAKEIKKDEKFVGIFISILKKKGYIKE